MRKFFRVFFFLLFFFLISETLYLNYVSIGSGEVAILEEKTSGVSSNILTAGNHWIWGVSIPGKYKIHRLKTGLQSREITFRRKILEAAHLDLGEKFDIVIPLRLNFTINKDKIMELFYALERDFSRLPYLLQSKISPLLYIKYNELSSKPGESSLISDRLQIFIQDKLKEKVNASLTKFGIKISSLVIDRTKELQVPTLSYEERIRFSRYEDYFQRRKEEILKNIKLESKLELEKKKNKIYFDKLKQLGRLLENYPLLLDYIRIEKLNPNVSVIYGPASSNPLVSAPPAEKKGEIKESKNDTK